MPFPTRSGVLGMLAACMGIARRDTARLFELAREARVHVRVDAPGVPLIDDQTIQDNPRASATRKTIRSKRRYLCDASFVAVVVPGPGCSLEDIRRAIDEPVFAPFLGRRACAPSEPLLLESEVVAEDPLELFTGIRRGPSALVDQLRLAEKVGDDVDFYLDVTDHPRGLRHLPLRDDLAGPLPRQFRERVVVHARERIGLGGRPDSLDPWMTRPLS